MMKLNIGANIGPISVGTEINTNSIKQKVCKLKDDFDKNKVRKYKFCFYLEQTDYVTEYALIKTSIKEVEQKINDLNLILKATHYGLTCPSISEFFDKTQIIGEIKEYDGSDGIEKEDFDISIGF